jgi:transcriptional regulator with XRE-family HTH domain
VDEQRWEAARLGPLAPEAEPSARATRTRSRAYLADRLRRWRAREQISARELAGRLQVSTQRSQALQSGAAAWSKNEFEAVAQLLQVSCNQLLDEIMTHKDGATAEGPAFIGSASTFKRQVLRADAFPELVARDRQRREERARLIQQRRERHMERRRCLVQFAVELSNEAWQEVLTTILTERASTRRELRDVVLAAAEEIQRERENSDAPRACWTPLGPGSMCSKTSSGDCAACQPGT